MRRSKERIGLGRINLLRAKVISWACILGFLVGLALAMQGEEGGTLLLIISIVVGILNKVIFGLRVGQLKIDSMERIARLSKW